MESPKSVNVDLQVKSIDTVDKQLSSVLAEKNENCQSNNLNNQE